MKTPISTRWFAAGLLLHLAIPAFDARAAQQALKASNTGNVDSFGSSVTVDGDTMVIGATGEDSNVTGLNGNQGNNSTSQSGGGLRLRAQWDELEAARVSQSVGRRIEPAVLRWVGQ